MLAGVAAASARSSAAGPVVNLRRAAFHRRGRRAPAVHDIRTARPLGSSTPAGGARLGPPGVAAAPPLQRPRWCGAGLAGGAQGAPSALQLSVRVLLVRLLAPDDFGRLAMVTVVAGFLLMFQDLGFGPALVRKEW